MRMRPGRARRLALGAAGPAFLLLAAAPPARLQAAAPADETLSSPDGRLVATLTVGEEIRYALSVDGKPVLAPASTSRRGTGSST
jgi:hypothetical protein